MKKILILILLIPLLTIIGFTSCTKEVQPKSKYTTNLLYKSSKVEIIEFSSEEVSYVLVSHIVKNKGNGNEIIYDFKILDKDTTNVYNQKIKNNPLTL